MKNTAKPTTSTHTRKRLSDELILNIGAIVFAVMIMIAAIVDNVTSHQRAMTRLRMKETCKCR